MLQYRLQIDLIVTNYTQFSGTICGEETLELFASTLAMASTLDKQSGSSLVSFNVQCICRAIVKEMLHLLELYLKCSLENNAIFTIK